MGLIKYIKNILNKIKESILTPNTKRPYLFKDPIREDIYIDKNGVFVDKTLVQLYEEEIRGED